MEPLPREHERLGDEIATLSAHLDAATHRFLTLIRRFDACGGFAAQGALTCAHWLSWRVGLELGQVRPEEAAILRRAMEVAASRAWSDEVSAGTRAAALRRADALVAVAESYLATTPAEGAGPPVEIVVHVEQAGGTLDDGTALPDAVVERLACDAAVLTVVEDSRRRRRRRPPTPNDSDAAPAGVAPARQGLPLPGVHQSPGGQSPRRALVAAAA